MNTISEVNAALRRMVAEGASRRDLAAEVTMEGLGFSGCYSNGIGIPMLEDLHPGLRPMRSKDETSKTARLKAATTAQPKPDGTIEILAGKALPALLAFAADAGLEIEEAAQKLVEMARRTRRREDAAVAEVNLSSADRDYCRSIGVDPASVEKHVLAFREDRARQRHLRETFMGGGR